MASSSNSSCSACKFVRQECNQHCLYAQSFLVDDVTKMATVYNVFNGNYVDELLKKLSPAQTKDAINFLYYEAAVRLTDPRYGCLGRILSQQRKANQALQALQALQANTDLPIDPMLPPSYLQDQQQQLYSGYFGTTSVSEGMPLIPLDNHQSQQYAQQLYSGYVGTTRSSEGMSLIPLDNPQPQQYAQPQQIDVADEVNRLRLFS
ncbi:LOB domain-containing protein 25-like [Telopea speciosissima]|uniref:LOB domain-containing protein 25-like n=1 Tax=Telopea speciosissima TaxID=54955 RepID=UPI001CC5C0CC|nr:LOB domain-containing protein 25-like [Telopea speciosissima]